IARARPADPAGLRVERELPDAEHVLVQRGCVELGDGDPAARAAACAARADDDHSERADSATDGDDHRVMADVGNVVEVFSAPLEGLVAALGRDISSAQAELDRNALRAQEEIDSDPQLAGLGLQAPWHQLPRVDFQVKLALTTAVEAPAQRAGAGAQIRPSAVRLIAQPPSAAYQHHVNY